MQLREHPRFIWMSLCVVVLAGLVAGIVSYATNQVRPESYDTMRGYSTQPLTWSKCGKAECSTILVPLDYDDLDGRSLSLRLERVRATEPDGRSLFLNLGGPGAPAADGSAEWMAEEMMSRAMRERFDIVGLDPRGTGEGNLVDCVSDRGVDRLYSQDPTPDDPAEVDEFMGAWHAFGRSCLKRSTGIATHISTEEAARDFDIARAAVGVKKLDFIGFSYGTQLGATYATLFPDKVGRMVLDAAVDPALSWTESWVQQSAGFHLALTHYVDDCLESRCPLGSSPEDVFAAIAGILSRANEQPIPATGEPDLTEGLAYVGTFAGLYGSETWSDLTKSLVDARRGNGTQLRALAFDYLVRELDGTYLNNENEAFPAIMCNDTSDRPTVSEIAALVGRFESVSPVLGRADTWAFLSVCAGFPPALHPQIPIDAADSSPILVLGSTGDPATPVAWAKSLTQQLGSAIQLTRDGEGHTSYDPAFPCTRRIVDRYFLTGKLPRPGATCSE